jgi:hypothetical protein
MSEERKKKEKPVPINLSSLKNNEKRSIDRIPTLGNATIHDLIGQKAYKAAVRNMSPGGICFEVGNVTLKLHASMMIEFEGHLAKLGLGTIKCTLQWITPIKAHPSNNQLLGLQFMDDLSGTKRKKLEDHIALLTKGIWS